MKSSSRTLNSAQVLEYMITSSRYDKIKDLLLYYSNTTESMTTLKDYNSRMADDQKYIYYAVGESRSKIQMMPIDGPSLQI